MYPFAVQSGSTDGGDARAIALLQQHQRLGLPLDRSIASRLSAQQGRSLGVESMMDASLSSLNLSRGLPSSEVMSASSMKDRERILTAELLKHRVPNLGHQEQLATAIALASRNQVLSKQQQGRQDPQENLILKRAISQLSAMHHGTQSRSGNSPVFCAEQDLSLEKDICFGRGQRVQRRKANVAFRKIVATYQETYDQAVSREDKKAVVKKVSRIFSRTGYRFFKESEEPARFGNGSKLWCAVSDHHVEYKIGHSFRSGRKQLKQQKNQRKEKEASDVDVRVDISSEVKPKKIQSNPIIPKDPSDHCVYKDDELSDKCICIGDKREKYTGMEAYQYFREFILTFKSILGMTESSVEKKKIVSGLIDQIKTQKGYKFLKLMQLKKDVEFWIEASAEEITSEVFSIIGDIVEANEKSKVPSADENTKAEMEQTNLKRPSDTTGDTNDAPKKRQCVSPDTVRPDALKRNVSDIPSRSKDDSKKRDVVSSSSSSLATNEKEKSDTKFVWKKGRKRTLPEGFKRYVPSEIICKPNVDQIDGVASKNVKSLSKLQGETMSAISAQGVRIPPSLISSDAVLGNLPFGKHSSGALERSIEMLRGTQSFADTVSGQKASMGNRLPAQDYHGRSILEKALLAMQPSSIHRTRERSMVENTDIETAKKLEMKGQLLQQLRQQELLYLEKKHKLAMLELQLQARNGGV